MDHLNSNLLANSAVEGMELKMAERSSATVSRRSTRLFVEEQDNMERGNAGQILSESRYGPSGDEKEKEKPQRDEKTSLTSNTAAGILPMVNLGKDIGGIFPTTVEDMAKHGTQSQFNHCADFYLPCSGTDELSSHGEPPSRKGFNYQDRWPPGQLWCCHSRPYLPEQLSPDRRF
jgi:tyrosine-protein phosphatase SIW14